MVVEQVLRSLILMMTLLLVKVASGVWSLSMVLDGLRTALLVVLRSSIMERFRRLAVRLTFQWGTILAL